MAKITLEGVSKRYPNGTEAVASTHLSIEDGEFFILVGPSGCGKSTLLKMIVGLETPTSGEVRVDGRAVTGVDPKDRNMAMVFQSYALYPHMTVRQNIEFPLKLAKLDRGEVDARVRRTAEILEIGELLDRKPGALSGGQRQRVAMGRAIVREPVAFLLDEPLSNLDAKLRVQMRAEIARLQKRLGTTTIYVTHDQTEAMTLGDHLAVLRKGRVQQVGTPRELYERPRNLFVAGFIGSPGMNFLPARVEDGRLILPMLALPLPSELRDQLPSGRAGYVAGIRPEHLHAVTTREAGASFRAPVEVVEWSGADVYVHLEIRSSGGPDSWPLSEELGSGPGAGGRLRLVARVDSSVPVEEGEPLELAPDPDKIALFDSETGERVGRPE